ncbi:MAG: winged helix-turn-helix transcriptional regulator [Thaumarchaeota archaeon]|nr:winged helix-turn-helix transcriptional regulator [Nitrososphaerota archaeon]
MLSCKEIPVHKRENSSYYNTTVDTSRGTDVAYAKNLLWMVFANSRGGNNRIRIIMALKKSPLNAHQLAKELELNYRAIQHHIGVLEKNSLVSHVGEKYGTVYYLSTLIEVNMVIFDELVTGLYKGK